MPSAATAQPLATPETAPAVEAAGPTMQLAEFVAGVRGAGVPDAVRAVLQDAVVDAVGCGLFGLTQPACSIVQAYALEQGGPPEATLWASGGAKVSVGHVALAAGTAIHGFDFDDHHRSKIHAGAAVLPVVLALGEREDIDGPTFLAALAAGYETMARVSLSANPNAARMRGWHLTGTTGTFGAAAAASVILGFDASTTASALGLAGTQSAGLWAFNSDGAMSKRLHPGRAAESGVLAAALAGRGFQGPRFILEAEDGGFLAAMSDASRPGEAGRALGREWRAEGVCFKPYACCGSNHASVDATIELMAEHDFSAADVARVKVGISRVVERQTGFPYKQSTVLNAQMSIRYNVAVALLDGTALVEQFTPQRIAAADVNELTSRVDVEVDADMDAVYPERYAGIVTITLKDGREVRKRVDFSRGMPENRIPPEAMRQKFLSLAGGAVGSDAATELLERLSGIFDCDSIAAQSRALGALRLLERRPDQMLD
ncbi:MmgE/PrpD family protein [Aquabacter sp. CN5-332]|uniref:MmgE/PrpD family protein n=1 Tax=Aquabacter sp. CN5-332 TaxID=3156608 RepID=UPI0032B4C39A